MKARHMRRLAVATLLACAACAGGAPGPDATPSPATAPVAQPDAAPEAHAARDPADADVAFMQGMIVHHVQALDMTALVEGRAGSADLRNLAERIDVSQRDEIARMERWLRARGEEVPATGAHAAHAGHGGAAGHAGMPGMASPEEMRRLANATGAAFDRLFLELMIRHHEGALVMVRELFATPGAGQEPELFQFANHVDADQRMEIARMRALLEGRR